MQSSRTRPAEGWILPVAWRRAARAPVAHEAAPRSTRAASIDPSTVRVGVRLSTAQLGSTPLTAWALALVSQSQSLESGYQRRWFDAEHVCGAVRPVDSSLCELKRGAEVLLLFPPPVALSAHGTWRITRRQSQPRPGRVVGLCQYTVKT